MTKAASTGLVWQQLQWQRPLEPARAVSLLRRWATDQRSPRLALETAATAAGLEYRLGVPPAAVAEASACLIQLLPGTSLLPLSATRRPSRLAMRLKASTRHRALRSADPEATVRAILGALTQVRGEERLVLQVLLGARRVPLAISTHSPSSVVAPWPQVLWHGNSGQVDSEKRSALRDKVSDHGFACTVRIGVTADSVGRRRTLVLGVLAAIRTSEAAGITLRLRAEWERRLDTATGPWFWPLRLNVQELLALTAWPLGSDELPGQPPAHPKPLRPAPNAAKSGRVVARATAPGRPAKLVLSTQDALQHSHVLGPTGVGKSALLGRLIQQDIQGGQSVVVVEPKGDLIDDVLARLPASRLDDVVVLDAADAVPVGLNPLVTHGQRPEVVADGILSVFKALYADAWGPRTQDILHACLLTLARQPDATLVMLPLLLTNTGLRRSLTRDLADPLALGPFWAWYDNLTPGERNQAIAPLMNKLRQWLLRPSLRAVLGQRQPRFDLRQVFTERKILLVPLRKGVLGPEAAGLLGSLVVSQLWQATQERAAVPATQRHPVMVYIDEVQDYLHLPTDLGDALAQARGFGVGFTVAHQFLGQLPTAMRGALLTNARSKICFQLAQEDAVQMVKGHPELEPADFTALGQYQVYASLFAGGAVTPYASGATLAPDQPTTDPDELRQRSRQRYGRSLAEIEADFSRLLEPDSRDSETIGRRRRSS